MVLLFFLIGICLVNTQKWILHSNKVGKGLGKAYCFSTENNFKCPLQAKTKGGDHLYTFKGPKLLCGYRPHLLIDSDQIHIVACINIPYTATSEHSASPVLYFLRVSDHLEFICKLFFFSRIYCDNVIHWEIFLVQSQKFTRKKNIANWFLMVWNAWKRQNRWHQIFAGVGSRQKTNFPCRVC